MHPLNRLLRPLGLRLTHSEPPPTAYDARIHIGPYWLDSPLASPLAVTYQQNPGYNAEIGRVAARTYARYPNMVAVDVGANVGDTAAIIRCACKAPIVCIDGDKAMEEVLVHNAAALGGVRTLTTYLSDRREERLVGIEKAGWNATLVPPDGATATASVPFTRLDDALTPSERKSTKLLKIDTEGHEAMVLRGAERLLRDARPVVLIEYNREALMLGGAGDDTQVFSLLREHGYQDALVWDCRGRFLLQTSLADTAMMDDLSAYIAYDGGPFGYIPYFDVGLFHGSDHALALECAAAERAARDTPAQ